MTTNKSKEFYINLKNKELFEILGRHVSENDLALLKAVFKFQPEKPKTVVNLMVALIPIAEALDELEETGISSGDVGYISFIKGNELEAYFALNELRARDEKLALITTPNGYLNAEAVCDVQKDSDENSVKNIFSK